MKIIAKIELLLEQEKFSKKDREVLLMLAKSLNRFSDAIEMITGGAS